jgi:electron transfer flavoprotein alpha subunit
MSVLIFADSRDGKFPKHTRELVSYGRRLAEALGTDAVALSAGMTDGEEMRSLARSGAQRIFFADDESFGLFDHRRYAALVEQTAAETGATHLLFSYSNTGKALAPLVAARLKAGYVSAVTGLPVSYEPFTVKKMLFSGKIFADIVIPTEKKVITLAPNAWEAEIWDEETVPEKVEVNDDGTSRGMERIHLERLTGKQLLTDADIVVSGGRGMQQAENFRLLEELAAPLGGAVACTRPVSDEGWRPPEQHAGQTGKIIAPDLYFAFGISGAIQHLAGVSGSKVIAAVNKDPDAPIFEAADYGITGDAMEVLPRLIEEVRRRKNL